MSWMNGMTQSVGTAYSKGRCRIAEPVASLTARRTLPTHAVDCKTSSSTTNPVEPSTLAIAIKAAAAGGYMNGKGRWSVG